MNMKNWILVVACLACFGFGWSLSQKLNEVKWLEFHNKQLNELQSHFEQRLNYEEERYRTKEKEYAKFIHEANTINDDYQSLLMQFNELRTENSRLQNTKTCTVNTTQTADYRRSKEMTSLLKRATDLIKERDEIAVQYNLLYKSCKL